MSSSSAMLLMIPIGLIAFALTGFLIYAAVKYAPIIGRIFEEKPLFLPLRIAPQPEGEDVRFKTTDGMELRGTYFPRRTESRAGVMVFCHEYLSDRWSHQPYVGPLRDRGFDVFSFDFRNHGASGSDAAYRPLQWVTDREVRDLRAALDYLRSRPDRDPAGVGLFGVSRGGSTALVVAAEDPGVWGVITDGAFPTRGTMLAYILRWAEIYVSTKFLWKRMPIWVFRFLGWAGRARSESRLGCRFPDVERAAAKLAPRPWLMIHGAKDAYIGPEIARGLYNEARDPKEMWIVAGAKHNRCRQVEPEAYLERTSDFLLRYGPRRSAAPAVAPAGAQSWDADQAARPHSNGLDGRVAPVSAAELAAPVSAG